MGKGRRRGTGVGERMRMGGWIDSIVPGIVGQGTHARRPNSRDVAISIRKVRFLIEGKMRSRHVWMETEIVCNARWREMPDEVSFNKVV